MNIIKGASNKAKKYEPEKIRIDRKNAMATDILTVFKNYGMSYAAAKDVLKLVKNKVEAEQKQLDQNYYGEPFSS